MRMHTDKLNLSDIYRAAEIAEIEVVGATTHGSRSRRRALNFGFSGSGRYGGQWGGSGYRSATWDEWGIALAHLFAFDPEAHTGKRGYLDADHFRWSTGGRYDSLKPEEQHHHRWDAMYCRAEVGVTGRYYVTGCRCGAVRRWLSPDTQWDDIKGDVG